MGKYFNIKELSYSRIAAEKGINNNPSGDVKRNLELLIDKCLDPIREAYGKPITVSSGYRNCLVNQLVGGKANSQHLKGEAADIVGKNEKETKCIFEIAKKGNYDQLLFERNKKGNVWVHISCKVEGNRHQCIDNYTV
jgi:hypothetical protein